MAQVLEIQPGGGYVTSLELATCRHGDVFICDAFSSQCPFGFTVLWELLDFIIKSEPLISRCHPVNTWCRTRRRWACWSHWWRSLRRWPRCPQVVWWRPHSRAYGSVRTSNTYCMCAEGVCWVMEPCSGTQMLASTLQHFEVHHEGWLETLWDAWQNLWSTMGFSCDRVPWVDNLLYFQNVFTNLCHRYLIYLYAKIISNWSHSITGDVIANSCP